MSHGRLKLIVKTFFLAALFVCPCLHVWVKKQGHQNNSFSFTIFSFSIFSSCSSRTVPPSLCVYHHLTLHIMTLNDSPTYVQFKRNTYSREWIFQNLIFIWLLTNFLVFLGWKNIATVLACIWFEWLTNDCYYSRWSKSIGRGAYNMSNFLGHDDMRKTVS